MLKKKCDEVKEFCKRSRDGTDSMYCESKYVVPELPGASNVKTAWKVMETRTVTVLRVK